MRLRGKGILGILALLAGQSLCTGQQNAELSSVIAGLMKGNHGAVVALDVGSGKILAQWNLQLAARRVTAPGSTVKPFVLLELLQSGKIDPEQHQVCRRVLTIAGRRMDCTHSPAVTNLDAADAIAYSCNSYFAEAARRLEPPELARSFERAGFTSRTELVPDEAVGRVVEAHAGDEEHVQLQALGYWGVEVTPLELLAAYRKLALHKIKSDLPEAAPVFSGLERSVQYGMAQRAQPSGITAAGKTGTAGGTAQPSPNQNKTHHGDTEARRYGKNEASNSSRLGTNQIVSSTGSQTHGFFVGYAPADSPEIVLVVYLEQGNGSDAAAIAAPIFSAYAKTGRGAGAAR
jgi:cell division protein FtsI/penicillin-binding protein 2